LDCLQHCLQAIAFSLLFAICTPHIYKPIGTYVSMPLSESTADSVSNSQNAASDSAMAARATQRSALSARRISCMPPPAPLTAARGPQRDLTAATPTPAGSTGGYSAKRIALQEQTAVPVMPSLEAAQQLQASISAIAPCSVKRCIISAVHLCQ